MKFDHDESPHPLIGPAQLGLPAVKRFICAPYHHGLRCLPLSAFETHEQASIYLIMALMVGQYIFMYSSGDEKIWRKLLAGEVLVSRSSLWLHVRGARTTPDLQQLRGF
jgi:hypothetical protein